MQNQRLGMAVRLAVVLVGLAVLVVGGARFMPAARAQESRGAGSDGRTFSGPLDSSAVSGSAAPSEEAAESADAADDAEGPSEAEEPAAEAQAEASEADAAAPDEQGEEGSPADEPASEGEDAAGDAPTGDGEGSEEKKEDDNLISLSFKNTPMEKIATFLSEKKNKPVIPHEEIRNTRLTIVATQKMALPEAMLILHEALRQHGVVIEEGPRVINLRPVKDIAQASLEVIGADESLEAIEDPSRIVRKVFSVEHYDVVRLKDAVVPMLPEFGEVVADPNSRKLMVRDAVSNLRRIEQLIRTLDVPMADQTMKQIIKLESADATWMVGVLKTMIETEPRSRERSRSGRENGPAVAIEQAAGRVLLVPEVTRNWIIAVAPADTMEQIRAWVEQLDKPAADEEAVRFHAVEYANPEDVARTITQALSSMPDFRQSVQVTSVPQSRRILVYGSPRGQELVEQLLAEVDVEDANERVREVIELDYADAEEVATNIEELFSNREVSYQTNSYTRYRYDQEAVQVRVIADTTRNAVTVIADPSTLGEIRKMVEEQWDVPIDTEDVQPRVYTLTYADSVQLRELLESLFSERSEGGSNLWDYYYGRGGDEATPVGRLYGQFSFQVMEDTNKLVVTTKNAAHYEVIDRLVKELDVPQEAGLPQIVHLQHANAEDLAEQLNAVLSQPGTLAEIRRNQRDLSDGPRVSDIAAAMDTNSDNNSRGRGDEADPDVMTFWWQRSRQAQDEAPLTNLVGSIRVVPVYRRNALLIVAPPAYLEPVREMVVDLDEPGMQVVIHAVIAEVQHDDQTTLGLRLASDPTLFNDPRLVDQSVAGNLNLEENRLFGDTFTVGENAFAEGLIQSDVDVVALLQLLDRNFDLNILFEPRLYTADNQEAQFFDGRDVSIQNATQFTGEGTLNRSFTYVPVGTRLRVRPHITINRQVAMQINLEVSRQVPGESTFGNPIFDRRETTTRVVVANEQTVMLSGIIRQELRHDVRKLPLLGDLPLMGGLFRSTEDVEANRELLVFITPYVISADGAEANPQQQENLEKLEEIRSRFGPVIEEAPGDRPEQEPDSIEEDEDE